MVLSRDQNSGRIPCVRTDNRTFERVEEFGMYLGTTLTNLMLSRKKLRADLGQKMLAIIRCIIFVLQVAIQKFKDQDE